MGTQFVTLPRIERTLKQRPEDGRFNETPVSLGRINEQLDLLDIQGDWIDAFEQSAVEALDGLHQTLTVATSIHGFPKRLNGVRKGFRVPVLNIDQKVLEGCLGQ